MFDIKVLDYLIQWNLYLFAYSVEFVTTEGTSGVEQYYNTVIVIDYQLQIPLHFGSTANLN